MPDLKLVPVRATISVGGLHVSTPYVVSFNVNRARGQISTFSATLKVHNSQLSGAVGGEVVIEAGPASNLNKVFTGICRSSNITPCRDDPAYVLLTISGNDVLSELQGKKITRRCKSSKTTWISITGLVRPGLKSGKLAYTPGKRNFHTESMIPREEDPVVRTPGTNIPLDSDVNHPKSKAPYQNPVIDVQPHKKEEETGNG